jgi:hypothetical protein
VDASNTISTIVGVGDVVRHRLVSVRYSLLVLPPVAITLALAVLAGSELAGSHPLTWGEPRSVPEAIALRDGAGAARLLEEGQGINEVGLIRAGILWPQAVLATPLEAAVLVDAAAMFEYLTAHGAHVTPDVGCLARDIGARAVRARIADASSCPPGAALHAVLDRP